MKTRDYQFNTDTIFSIVNYTVLLLLLIVMLYPLIFLLSASVSSPEAVWNGRVVLLPVGLSFEGYLYIFQNNEIWRSLFNTVAYTVLGTFINLFMTITAAYPLSRKEFMAKNFITVVYSFTLFFGGGLIPSYLLIRSLNMLDSIWAIILPGAVSVWFIIITRTFFQINIPNELLESAKIDGCSNINSLLKIVLPLSVPIIAALSLFFSVGHWNSFFNAFIYLSDRKKYPLQLILREIVVQSQVKLDGSMSLFDARSASQKLIIAEKIRYAVIVFSSLPLLVAYPFVQKHFKKGVLIGSIKG
jgi:putative aldouronate transport system permease protein